MESTPVLTYLEMSEPAHLRPARCEAGVALRPLPHGSPDVRTLTLSVGRQFGWPSQSWSAGQWATYLADRRFRHWAAGLDGSANGILSVNAGAIPDVEIDSFGLLPEHHGQGLGGEFLTRAVSYMWDQGARRIWLHTSSLDHPNALRNYIARGFKTTAPATA